MNKGIFVGRLAKEARFNGTEKSVMCRFTLIDNEYAGKDGKGDAVERKVAIPFTAFGKTAKVINEHVAVGDQLIVSYRVQNNDYEKDGVMTYGFSFVVDEFEFGAKKKA